MKNGITCLFLLWQMQTCLLHAQIHDHVLAFGFNTEPTELHALGDGRWLSIMRGESAPGALYSDSIVAVIFQSNGEILLRRHLDLPPSEVHSILSAVATPGGGFAVAIANDLCDASFEDNTILVFEPDGDLRWSKLPTDTESQPYLLKTAPDGNLTGIKGRSLGKSQIVKYELETGQILWEAVIKEEGGFSPYIRDFQFYPGTENLVAAGYPTIQYWEQTGHPDSPLYNLKYSQDIKPFVSPGRVIEGQGGAYYTFDSYDGRLIYFNWQNMISGEIADYPFSLYDAVFANAGFYLLAYDSKDSISYALQTDFNGQITDTLIVSNWETGYKIEVQNDTLAIAGVSGSGPDWAEAYWLPYNARHAWLHTRPLTGGTKEPEVHAALTGVEQGTPLEVPEGFEDPWNPGKRYNYTGGTFKVQLTNAGNTVIDQADVQIAFEWDKGFVCYDRPVSRRRYTGLALNPGASVWLDFGNIYAEQQPVLPSKLCFWSSAPNERPDANHDDDVFCHTAVLSDEEPAASQFSISPNPADNRCRLVLSAKKALVGQVYDIAGRLIQEMDIPAGENTEFDLQTGDWPDGMYFLQVENWSAKIVVQHR